jgi:membrane protein insertase Oxa1/YidC/SpoIIIJ
MLSSEKQKGFLPAGCGYVSQASFADGATRVWCVSWLKNHLVPILPILSFFDTMTLLVLS